MDLDGVILMTFLLYKMKCIKEMLCVCTVNKIKQKEGKCVCLAECFIRYQRHTVLEDRLNALKKI